MKYRNKNTMTVAVIGGVVIALILIFGSIWMGRGGKRDTDKAVHSVSLLYLDELAGRREQVVESNLQEKIHVIHVAIALMNETDLSDLEHLQAYQSRMRQLYRLEKFAFVDREGLIYTSQGIQENIGDYQFDYRTIREPEISILNLETPDKKVVIAVPIDSIRFDGHEFVVCFMEIGMEEMLQGVSMQAENSDATFCNLYTNGGVALSNTVLGGLAVEDNLLTAMRHAVFEDGYSYDGFVRDFREGRRGEVTFTYNGILETLSYVPVTGTDWLLTYLIRESVISDNISAISAGIIRRSVIQLLLSMLVLLAMFSLIIAENRKNARLALEKETADTENRVKREALEQRLALQDQLLQEEKRRTMQDQMITAMASDYRIVYHVDLDKNDAVCYRADPNDKDQTPEGVHFPFYGRFSWYGSHVVAEPYREGFLRFIDPENIRQGLKNEKILAYRYLAQRADWEYYEMIRIAGVQRENGENSGSVLGVGLTVIDAEMRASMAQQQALSDALAEAEQANRAKTVFLSNMSHEIRTPMNAIIGLDSIALNDPEVPEKTRGYLEKIGASAQHLLGLINDVLDMSRIESGRLTIKKEEFSFPKLLDAVNTMFSSQCADKGLDYQCHINGEVDSYYIGDNMKLRQVLINILGNAVKFTPSGGKVSFTVQRTAQYDGYSTLRFTVSDTGIGMSPEFLPHLFDTFSQEDASTTSKYGSSGLGMAITRSIVEMMNGSIDVESEKGKGTTFVVTVTLMDSDRRDAQQESIEVRPEDMTVLIVDDDPIACEHARLVLSKAGINSEIADSGAKAVEMVRLRHTRREPYNLILVDWQMPEMDGVETTRQIRAIIGNETAIIILTAYRWDDVLEDALAAGVDSFIPKPLFAAALMEEFKSALKKKALTAAPEKNRADLAGKRILLAEDIDVNAEIMMMILESREMTADLAANGRIAVEKFAAHEPGYYSAILMDMRMPEMDGLEATQTIRAMDRPDAKTIPIIALTANAFDEDVQRSLQAGLNAHLSKPVQPDTLYATLESLI